MNTSLKGASLYLNKKKCKKAFHKAIFQGNKFGESAKFILKPSHSK